MKKYNESNDNTSDSNIKNFDSDLKIKADSPKKKHKFIGNNGNIENHEYNEIKEKIDFMESLPIILSVDKDKITKESGYDIYKVIKKDSEIIYILAKQLTPGGRENLNNEFRIQAKGENFKRLCEIEKEGNNTVVLGIYNYFSNLLIAAWEATDSSSNTSVSKQVKVETLLEANNIGISQQKIRNGKLVCVFKKDFIDFYLKYKNKLHDHSMIDIMQSNVTRETNNKSENLEYNNVVCHSINKNIQSIYFGAPGTGKSHDVKKLIEEVYPEIKEKENPFVFKTTIYSDYSYYDFVGNLVPTQNGGKLEYAFNPGIFTQALARALNYPSKDIFLVIEEMTRGNIASIFGDIFQLLDRKKDGTSDYSINNNLISDFLSKSIENGGVGKHIKKIELPRNLHILGTVNTSDQNVNVMDTAFKRRFNFIYSDVAPVKEKDEKTYKNTFKFILDGKEFEWNKFYMSLNKLIIEWLELSEDKQIGQFFIKFDDFYGNDEDKYDVIKNKLLNYLWEDVQTMSIDEERSIFDSKYKTFSKLYTDFGNEKNIFSDKLIEIYDSIKLDS